MGSREKWVRGSLLPNLYARYQARDKRYSSIPVSERQAYLLGCAISTATRREGGLIWQGRTVYLSKFGSWPKRLRIAFEWAIGLFYPRDISKLG